MAVTNYLDNSELAERMRSNNARITAAFDIVLVRK